jgi:hypothetical protein
LGKNFGINKKYQFSKVLPLIYRYSYAYELEYSSYDMILKYGLAYSFYVMILPYRTLCLIIHIIHMIRNRAKLRWRFIMPSGVPQVLYLSIRRVGDLGGLGSFSICEHSDRVYRCR